MNVSALNAAIQGKTSELPEHLAAAIEHAKVAKVWDRVQRGPRSMAGSLLRYLQGEVPVYAADKRASGVVEANTREGRTSAVFRIRVPDAYFAQWDALDSVARGDFIARAFELLGAAADQ
ncbi:hypothetical protein [Deinococcus ruber]|uniref:Uncharacterized protein n=1 Tax=Deinococcus ruber TaxID=1848197 RepID=A0A918C819_9DEIO|nr:hypothetical protein [Deinococcus ruber]GGR11234.1 hypothetical protein GCM10008957_24920 [Deinococcus ruber]